MAGKKPRGKRMNVRVLLTILGVIAFITAGSVGYALVTGKIGGGSSTQDSVIEESKSAEGSTADASKEEQSKANSSAAESSKADSSKNDSSKNDSSKNDSSKNESSKNDASKTESSVNESSVAESSKEESKAESSAEESFAESSKEESSKEQQAESSKEEESEPADSQAEDPASHETVEPSGEHYDSTYLIRVNLSTNVVTVYAKDSNGSHTVPVNAMLCSPGPHTPVGTFEMAGKWRYLELVENMTGQYVSQILGDYLFHTIPSWGWDNDNVEGTVIVEEFNKQGTSCSHGCVRLYAGDAAWIYYNTIGAWESGVSTMIEIGYYGAGADPWGTPAKIGVPSYYTDSLMWDPTDPSDSNPWKHPSIEIPEDQRSITLNVGDSLPEIAVKGYDGCGYDISDSIVVNSNVNSLAAGEYAITYSLTNYYGYSTSETVKVTVNSNPVTGVQVDPASISIEAGKTANLTVKLLPEAATNQNVTFSTSDGNVANVDGNGTVTGVAAGNATITVTSSDNSSITAACAVTVTAAPAESSTVEESSQPAESSTPAESSPTTDSSAPTESTAESQAAESSAEESATGTGSSEEESNESVAESSGQTTETESQKPEEPAESSAASENTEPEPISSTEPEASSTATTP
ncbi:MAG: Ig-like domain-containing protein [Firmicutes bacterium]|nr:Ig-like domain-containing protein [Bacillota bacterium]